jgi:hypothetical protein
MLIEQNTAKLREPSGWRGVESPEDRLPFEDVEAEHADLTCVRLLEPVSQVRVDRGDEAGESSTSSGATGIPATIIVMDGNTCSMIPNHALSFKGALVAVASGRCSLLWCRAARGSPVLAWVGVVAVTVLGGARGGSGP